MFIDFRERGRGEMGERGKGWGEEKERERNINQLPPVNAPIRGLNLQPGYMPWPGIEPQPFGAGTMLQPTQPTSQGLLLVLKFVQNDIMAIFSPGMKKKENITCLLWINIGDDNKSLRFPCPALFP